MATKRSVRKAKATALATLLAGGTMLGSTCSSRDIRDNIVAGSLAYVKNGATAFWNTLVPADEVLGGFFNPTPQN